eukprot:s3664_g5.t1
MFQFFQILLAIWAQSASAVWPGANRFHLGGVSWLMGSSAQLAAICSFTLAMLGSAFVVPSTQLPQIKSKTLEVSRSVAPAASHAAPASGTSGIFSMAGVVAAATFLARRSTS